ncbi:MAG: 50S ribosomal protein L11 methyltransferase, partial [Parabacteroides sp.]|nr:50S ribosomal protein L11 methyltransferase [Parabacteroides sp.]
IIDPKMAFGTGNHETTYLMISEMLKLDLEGKELLDMGCGTAVLAILARLKGAKRVAAIDIDEWAYNNALENIRLNHTEDIQVALGGAEKIKEFGLFDIVFANINRNILLNDICQYTNSMKQGSILFMSGFYVEDIPAIEAECQKNGLKLDSYNERNNWVAVKVLKG